MYIYIYTNIYIYLLHYCIWSILPPHLRVYSTLWIYLYLCIYVNLCIYVYTYTYTSKYVYKHLPHYRLSSIPGNVFEPRLSFFNHTFFVQLRLFAFLCFNHAFNHFDASTAPFQFQITPFSLVSCHLFFIYVWLVEP
jgi:hypothetical protein